MGKKTAPHILTVFNIGIAILIQLMLYHIGFGNHDYFLLALGLMGVHTWVYMSALLIVYANKVQPLKVGQLFVYIFFAPLVPLKMIQSKARVIVVATICLVFTVCIALLRVFDSEGIERLLLLAINYFSTVSIYGIVHYLFVSDHTYLDRQLDTKDVLMDHESWIYIFISPLHMPINFLEFSTCKWKAHCQRMFDEIKIQAEIREMRMVKGKENNFIRTG